MSLNIVILRGNVGAEPMFKEFSNGGCVLNIRLATTKKGFKNKDGKFTKPTTEWHNDVKMYNSMAKSAMNNIHKGDDLLVVGELHYNDKSKDNVPYNRASIIVKSYDCRPRTKQGEDLEQDVQFATDDFLNGLF